MSLVVQVFGRDRRVGECLLLREEQKSEMLGMISVLDPERTSRNYPPPTSLELCALVVESELVIVHARCRLIRAPPERNVSRHCRTRSLP